jgi:hypothetical protein
VKNNIGAQLNKKLMAEVLAATVDGGGGLFRGGA